MPADDYSTSQHLIIVQGVINRLENIPISLKGISATITAGAIALLGAMDNPSFVIFFAGAIPIFMFFLLDTVYLQLGRMYRKLYDSIRAGETEKDYTLDASPFKKDVDSLFDTAISWSVWMFYFANLLALFLITAYVT